MAPEHLTVTRDMLSPFALSLLDPARLWTPSEKLVPNLLDKTKYVANYRNLQLYMTRARHNENTQDPVVHAERLVKTMDRSV